MKKLLLELESYLKDNNSTVLQHLKPGIDITKLNIDNPWLKQISNSEELRILFGWHSGTAIDYETPCEYFYLFPTYFLMSLDQIEESIATNEVFEFVANDQLPIFATGHGEYLTVNLTSLVESPKDTIVYYACTWDSERELYTAAYDNIYRLFEITNYCFKKGIYTFQDGIVDADMRMQYKAMLKLNKIAKDNWDR